MNIGRIEKIVSEYWDLGATTYRLGDGNVLELDTATPLMH